MTTDLGLAAEQAIAAYTDWLNEWHKGEGDINGDGKPTQVTRVDYDEYDDPPVLIHEFREHPDDDPRTYIFDNLMLIIRCTPYHDEGGHTILTAWFTYTDRVFGADNPDDASWRLTDMVQEFDTMRQLIFKDSRLINTPDDLRDNDRRPRD